MSDSESLRVGYLVLTIIGKLGIISENLVRGDRHMSNIDEILSAAQESPVSENEDRIFRKAVRWAIMAMLIFLIAMSLIERFVFKRIDFGKPFIVVAFAAIVDLVEAHELKNKKSLAKGIVKGVFALFLLLLWIGGLLR